MQLECGYSFNNSVDLVSYYYFFFFEFQICSVGANACKPEQILWKSAAGKPGQCLDCPTCPPGSQPSVPCGTTIKNWTAMHCVPCQLGKTYSDKFDKGQCKACTICSTGKAVMKNCTRLSNSQCSKCKQGYYYAPFSFACKFCSECCGDEKDEVARECRNSKHKCKVRSTHCNDAQTTPLKTTTPSYNTTSTATQMTVPKKSVTTTTRANEEEKRVPYDELKSSMKPTLSVEVLTGKAEESGKQGDTNEAVILSVIIVFAALAVMVCLCILALLFKKNFDKLRDMLRPSREVDSKNSDNNISQSRQRSESSQSASQSCRSTSPLLNRAESSQNNPFTLHQHNGLAPNLPNESTLPQSGGSSSLPPVKPPESSLPSRSEASHPIQSGSSQSESVQSSESTLLLHNRAESSKTNGNALPQTKGSAEASHVNRSESSQSDRYTPSPVTSGCGASSQPDGSESPHSNQCESVELNPLSVFPLPSPCQSPQYSGYASSQPTGSDWSANDQYEFKPGKFICGRITL